MTDAFVVSLPEHREALAGFARYSEVSSMTSGLTDRQRQHLDEYGSSVS